MREPKLYEEVFHVKYGRGIVTYISRENNKVFAVCFKDHGYLHFHVEGDRWDFFLEGDKVKIRRAKKNNQYTPVHITNQTEDVIGIFRFHAFMDHNPNSVSHFTAMNKNGDIVYAVTVNHVDEQAVHEYEEAKKKLERLRDEAHVMEKQIKWLEQRIDPVDGHFSEFDETSPNYFFNH